MITNQLGKRLKRTEITTGESHDSPVVINLKSNTMKNTVQI